MALTKVSGPLLHGSNDNLGNYVINNITGAAATFSSVSVGGTLTYDDVTNVDSIGIVTARGGLHVGAGGTIIYALSENNGTIGINSSSPDTQFKLDAVGSGIFTKDGTFTSSDFNKGQFTVRNTTASQGAFLDFRAASSNGARGVIAKIGGFNTKTGSGYDGELTFSTRQNSDNTMVERLRINKDGEVGIGTDNPTTNLQVNDASNESTISLYNAGTKKIALQASNNFGSILYSYDDEPLIFSVHSGSSFSEKLRISSGGSVSIGTTIANERVNIHTASSLKAQVQFTNTTTGTAAGDGLVFGITGGEEAIIWNQENTSMKFATGNTQHICLTSTGTLGIGTDFNPPADAKRLTVICDGVGDGIHIGNKENLYPAGSTGYSDIRFSFYDYLTGGYQAGGEAVIRGFSHNAYTNSRTTQLIFMTSSDDGDPSSGNATEKVRITHDGDVAVTTRGSSNTEGVSKVNVEIPARTTAFDASDGDTWHDVLIENPGGATNNAVGLAFQVTGQAYHKNAGTGICAIKNGTNSDYGADLAFITRPQSAVAQERLRIYSNGAVLIGADANEAGGEAKLAIDCEGMDIFDDVGDPTNYGLIFANDPTTNKANGIGFFNDSASTCGGYIVHQDRGSGNIGDLLFGTSSTSDTPVERLRIASNGHVGINYGVNPNRYLQVRTIDGAAHNGVFAGENVNASNAATMFFLSTFRDSSSTEKFMQFNRDQDNNNQGVAAVFDVLTNGNVRNSNNSYSSISDVKLKENIIDASSQWNDIKNLRVRKFNFKSTPSETLIGVVAQEIETVSPGLVDDIPDMDLTKEGHEGTSTKSVKYSVLYMKAIKCLQEAQARIETLEAKVAALEGS